jgi:hypothetical protein
MSVTSGTEFTLNWKHQNASGAYSYAVSYSCAAGLSVEAPLPTGAYQAVACNTPFNFTDANTSITLVPKATGGKNVATTFTVVATKLATGAITASASGGTNVIATSAIKPSTAAKPAKTAASKGSYVASGLPGQGRYSNLYGSADLAVYITSAQSRGGNTTVQFIVENLGTNVSASNWSFVANLPINGGYQYPSQGQRALYPGDKIAYTLSYADYGNYQTGYQNCGTPYNYSGTPYTYTTPCYSTGYNQYSANYGNYGYGATKTVSVSVDPYNLIPEYNKANNYASQIYVAY